MFPRIKQFITRFDWILFFAVFLLVCFGLIELYSIGLGREGVNLGFFRRQLFFALAGLGIMLIFSLLNYRLFFNYAGYIFLLAAILLVAVLLFGQTIRGTRGWIYIGDFIRFQPVEFVKIALLVFFSRYFYSASVRREPIKHFFISGLSVLFLSGLVMLQPDFGSAVLLFLLWLVFIPVAGFKKIYFFLVVAMLLGVFASGWLFFFQDYQKERILTFLNPEKQAMDQGYNIAQAIIAVGAGRLAGRGIGFGSQSQLKFLPEAQNDFIYAVVSEELGLLGAGLLIFFFAVIFYRLFHYVRRGISNDGLFFLYGLAVLIFLEMFINIGMNIGLLPVIGISLPFVSYGGSALWANMIMIGIAQSIIIRSKTTH